MKSMCLFLGVFLASLSCASALHSTYDIQQVGFYDGLSDELIACSTDDCIEDALKGRQPITIRIETISPGDEGYGKVLLISGISCPHVQLWTNDGKRWIDMNTFGYGPFALDAEHAQDIDVFIVSDEPGGHAINIRMVDIETDDTIASSRGAIYVGKERLSSGMRPDPITNCTGWNECEGSNQTRICLRDTNVFVEMRPCNDTDADLTYMPVLIDGDVPVNASETAISSSQSKFMDLEDDEALADQLGTNPNPNHELGVSNNVGRSYARLLPSILATIFLALFLVYSVFLKKER